MHRRIGWTRQVATVLAAVVVLPVMVFGQSDPYADYRTRQEIDLRGTFRDFKPFDQADGHPDFGAIALDGYGRFARVPDDFLDNERKPSFSTSGFKVLEPWLDADGRQLMPPLRSYVSTWAGDVAGRLDTQEGGAVSGDAPFAQWFRDTAGLTTGQPGTMRLARVPGEDRYQFNGYIDGPGLRQGAPQADTNATYSYEFETTFIYEDDRAYFIEAISHGDFWVFIDNRLVLDGGAGSSIPVNYAGIIVDGRVTMANSAEVRVAAGTTGQVNTNATGPSTVFMKNQTRIFADVNVGPGGVVSDINPTQGAQITGTRGVLSESIPMPPMPAVPNLGPSTGNWVRSGGTPTLSGDLHCADFLLQTNAILRITGPTRVVCDGTFEIRNDCHVRLDPGATLEIHITNGPIFMGNNSRLNINTANPALVTIFNHSGSEIYMDNGFIAYANFFSPNAQMRIANGIDLFGSFFGLNLDMSNSARFTMMAAQEPIGGWGEGDDLQGSQRIDLDRLAWLQHDRTYRLKVFFADRVVPKSVFRLDTNIMTLNLANAARDLAKID